MTSILFKNWFSSNIKEERKKIFQDIQKLLLGQGSKLDPIPRKILSYLPYNLKKIYRIYDMDKVPWGKGIKELDPDALFFASQVQTCGAMRFRKYATFKFKGKQYVAYQQTIILSLVIAILDVEDKKRYSVNSMDQLVALLKVLHAPLEDLPLIINDPRLMKNKVFKETVQKRVGYHK